MMYTEKMIKAALDGQFFAINFNTGRVMAIEVAKDYIPDHKPQFFDFLSMKAPLKEAKPIEVDEIAAGAVVVNGAPTLKEILSTVGAVLKIGKLDLISPRRAPNICQARHIFFWFARHYTARSYPEIGMFCGNRDHSTVMHGIKKIDRDFESLRFKIEAIAARLGVDLEDRVQSAA